MYARIDEENRVAEIISDTPQGRYHPALQWVEVPEGLEELIDNQFWYDGKALNPPAEDYILNKVQARQRALFTATFAVLDEKSTRPQATVLAALMMNDAVPEPDADYIWQYEDIRATNRELLRQLEAATDWEVAQNIEPWLPPTL